MNGNHSDNRELWDRLWGTSRESTSAGYSETFEYEVQPHEWSRLRNGGQKHAGCVDAYLYQSGRVWRGSAKTFLKVSFQQGD